VDTCVGRAAKKKNRIVEQFEALGAVEITTTATLANALDLQWFHSFWSVVTASKAKFAKTIEVLREVLRGTSALDQSDNKVTLSEWLAAGDDSRVKMFLTDQRTWTALTHSVNVANSNLCVVTSDLIKLPSNAVQNPAMR
jgi:hypothetical protein